MRILFLSLIGAATLAAVSWTSLLDQSGGAKVHFGASLSGPEPYARNPAELFAPASTNKLFTAATALARLGPDFRYRTLLEWQPTSEGAATNVRLLGSGDPTWGMTEFGESLRTRVTAIAKELKKAGVSEVQGEISVVSADSRWEDIEIPAGWKAADPLSCGGTLAQAFNLDINCSTLKVSSPNSAAWATGATTLVDLRIKEGANTKLSVSLARGSDGRLGYIVSGTWKKKSAAKTFTLPVWGTSGWIRNLLTAALRAEGIRLTAASHSPSLSSTRKIEFSSLPLSQMLKPFLKNSINFMGDAILKTLAAEGHRPEASLLEGGLAEVKDYLLRAGVPAEFELHDGAGLSRTSTVTPRAMLAFLEFVRHEPYFPAFWDALAIAGKDGTLRNRMKGTAAAGRLRGKTGTLDGVYNLAGFVPEEGGYVPFVLLTKTTTAKSAVSRAAEDRVGAQLASIVPKPRSFEPAEPFPIYVPEHAGQDDQ